MQDVIEFTYLVRAAKSPPFHPDQKCIVKYFLMNWRKPFGSTIDNYLA
jgi:hypothetical protein